MYLTLSQKYETERVRHTIRMLFEENFNAHIEMKSLLTINKRTLQLVYKTEEILAFSTNWSFGGDSIKFGVPPSWPKTSSL